MGGEVLIAVPSLLSPGIAPERVAGISEAVLRILNTRNILLSSLCLRASVVKILLRGGGLYLTVPLV